MGGNGSNCVFFNERQGFITVWCKKSGALRAPIEAEARVRAADGSHFGGEDEDKVRVGGAGLNNNLP